MLSADWTFDNQPFDYRWAIRSTQADGQFKAEIPDGPDLAGIHFPPGHFLMANWNTTVNHQTDPIARSVLLVRPADRWEMPSYEEQPNSVVPVAVQANWIGQRLFPVKVRSWGVALEQFLMHVLLDRFAGNALSTWAFDTWSNIYTDLTGRQFNIAIRHWPLSRVGPTYNPQMSSLSAGELDVLVTSAIIITQSLGLSLKYGEGMFPPRGVVFIDEIDAHLHPQWQQKIVPILTKHFPHIFFIITTHSPFVLRSLHRATSCVLRLPDGHVFEADFDAWQIEDILSAVFEVPAEWTTEVTSRLTKLRELVGDESRTQEAIRLYEELDRHDSAGLQAEIKRIAGLYGRSEFIEAVAKSIRSKVESDDKGGEETT